MHSKYQIPFFILLSFGILTFAGKILLETEATPQVAMATQEQKTVQTSTDNNQILNIDMTASHWAFSPNNIEAKAGQTILLTITTSDDMDMPHGHSGEDEHAEEKPEHSFTVTKLGIDELLYAGKTSTITLQIDKKGTYTFFCNIPCGMGHERMKGTITIT